MKIMKQNARFIDEKLKTKSLMLIFLVFYVIWKISNFNVNRKAFGASFLYLVDFKKIRKNNWLY